MFQCLHLSYIDCNICSRNDCNQDEDAHYKYQVLYRESHCVRGDCTSLAPRSTANFAGAVSEDARAVELLGVDVVADGGVAK